MRGDLDLEVRTLNDETLMTLVSASRTGSPLEQKQAVARALKEAKALSTSNKAP